MLSSCPTRKAKRGRNEGSKQPSDSLSGSPIASSSLLSSSPPSIISSSLSGPSSIPSSSNSPMPSSPLTVPRIRAPPLLPAAAPSPRATDLVGWEDPGPGEERRLVGAMVVYGCEWKLGEALLPSFGIWTSQARGCLPTNMSSSSDNLRCLRLTS
jgi:hypothetical protein